ncbi:MAG: response regulator transcription factor, partial [Flavobacteriia bacterium]|nr:response regulator transcription factor [Flavobacteriia bacterium]
DRSYISHMIENGAAGYLLKNASREEILQAVKQVNNGGMYLNLLEQSTSSSSSLTSQHPFITRREKEVLQLIAEGLTNQQIADKLFVSITTINSHRKNLLTKFEVSNTAALIRIAVEKRLI